MIARLRNRWRELTRAEPWSAKAWVMWAARFVALFVVLHLMGLREDTSVLSGTVVGRSAIISGALGLMYLFSYFAALLLAPPALVAALVVASVSALWARSNRSPEEGSKADGS